MSGGRVPLVGAPEAGRRAATARPRIAVVDYGAGNLVSIEQALRSVGAVPVLAVTPSVLARVDGIIVPGVGAAAPAMERLRTADLVRSITEWIAADRPYLGICLGLQLLFEASDEDGAQTLGILPGRVSSLEDAPTLPHIGWNEVSRRRSHPLFADIRPDAEFYFVHSYAGRPGAGAEDAILAETTHGQSFVSAVARGSLLGVQFHPERSGRDGLRVLANFASFAQAAGRKAA